MSQLANHRFRLLWVVGLAAAAVAILLGTVIATDGPAPGIADTPAVDINSADGTLPVGSGLPSAQYCAAYADGVGSDREAVPENSDANRSVPRDLRLPPWPDFWDPSANRLFVPRIDGQYTGTTDQIIVWGACKWGISTDVVRAMAVAESSWRQDKISDYVNDPALCVGGYTVPCPTSFGLLQLKHTTRPGSWPDSQQYTAFNVDYSLAVLRGCFEGWVTYLTETTRGASAGDNGYAAGDLSGCVGWHYSGEWQDDQALAYIQRVKKLLDEKPWTHW